jgi:predicted flap endonuclease-1-like 5' DNA nuclease
LEGKLSPGEIDRTLLTGRERKTPASFSYASAIGARLRVQRDTNHHGYGNVCDADLNGNGVVNFADLAIMKASFFQTGADLVTDLNGDGVVNFADLAIMKKNFFKAPGPAAGKP